MAPDDVVLGSTIRSKLLEPQSKQPRKVDSDKTSAPITDKKTSAAPPSLDNISTSQSLNNHASDLTGLLDAIGVSVKILEAANKGASSLENLMTEASSLAQKAGAELIGSKKVLAKLTDDASKAASAQKTSSILEEMAKEYNSLRDQINSTVEVSAYRGINLLNGDDLVTSFSKDGINNLITNGKNLTLDGIDLDKADFSNAKSIKLSIDQTNNILEEIRTFSNLVSSSLNDIKTRRDFTEQTIATLKSGASNVIDSKTTDINEEGARLLALQTAQQLSEGDLSLSLASETQQSILRLF